jgi:hypothetical protein
VNKIVPCYQKQYRKHVSYAKISFHITISLCITLLKVNVHRNQSCLMWKPFAFAASQMTGRWYCNVTNCEGWFHGDVRRTPSLTSVFVLFSGILCRRVRISISFRDSDASPERRWCRERHSWEYPKSLLDHQPEPTGAEDGPGLTRGRQQSTWEERVGLWKMRGTPARTFGRRWKARIYQNRGRNLRRKDPPKQNPREPRAEQGREEESGRNALRNIPIQDAG